MRESAPVVAALVASLLGAGAAAAEAPPQVTLTPPRSADQTAVSPHSRRFLPGPLLAHWAGMERVLDGELSPVTPRPLAEGELLPALSDQPRTTAYARAAHARGPRGLRWHLLELGSLHELQAGGALTTAFRVDERESRAEQGLVTLTLPLQHLWLVPLIGFGAGSDLAPEFVLGSELRSDRERSTGASLGFEASGWTAGRHRVMGKAGLVQRVGARALLEQRLSLGAWSGPEVTGDVTAQWLIAGLQPLGERLALYERATLTRGGPLPLTAPLTEPLTERPPERPQEPLTEPSPAGPLSAASAWSIDLELGGRYLLTPPYGLALQVDLGGQPEHHRRLGLELTFYGTLF